MVYTGWLNVAGTEAVNDARVLAYARALGIPQVRVIPPDALRAAVDDPVYVTPTADLAPWYDPAVPESARFAGFLGKTIVGVGRSTHTRTLNARVGDGSIAGPPRRAHREMAFTVLAVAADEAALSYGLAWLGSVLRGGLCGDDTIGDALCLFAAEPYCTDLLDPTCGDDEYRTLYGVVLLDGPSVPEPPRKLSTTTCAGSRRPFAAEVEFTLAATVPHIYRLPVTVATGATFTFPSPSGGCDVNWIPIGSGKCLGADPCNPSGNCAEDPNCQEPTLPVVPTGVDPCDCVAAPVVAEANITVATGVMPSWLEAVPVITLSTGSSEARKIRVRIASNPDGVTCSSWMDDPCVSCTEIGIPYLPANSVLTIDGRTERATLDCDGEPKLFGPGGGPVEWPVLDCGVPLCIQVAADVDHLAADATVSVQLVAREDLA